VDQREFRVNPFQVLLNTAMVGTGRQEPAAAVPGAVGQLLDQLAQAPSEASQRLLRMAAVASVCGHAGYRPPAAQEPIGRSPARGETLPATDAQLNARVLAPLLAEGPERLQHEAFQRLAGAGLRLAPPLLPAALEAGRQCVAIRGTLAAVLGGRGHWLAAGNPSWKYACGVEAGASPQEQWDHGSPEQRRAVFTLLRAQDAEAARDKLLAELPQLNARERAEFVGLMATGLTAADEAFLDGLLKDRSKEVRQVAAQLLAALPESRHARTVAAALAPLVRPESGLVRKRLVVEAPAAADPAWKDEGLDLSRPAHDSLGERAWWLYQLVRNAPLAWWSAHCDLTPGGVLGATAKSEWKEALWRGWRDAVLATANAAWAQALLEHGNDKSLGHDATALLGVLPLPEREQHWARALDGGAGAVTALLPLLLQACPSGHTLSPAFSVRVADAIHDAWPTADNGSLRYYLDDAICLLDASALPRVLVAVRKRDATAAGNAGARTERIILARQALALLVPSSTSHPPTP
jgi:hypothetical protein